MHDCTLRTLKCGSEMTGGSDGSIVSGDDVQEGVSASMEGDSGSEELDLPALDSFDGETRGPVDDFCSAATGPDAFLQPSQELAESAKQGLKASTCLPCTGSLYKEGLPIATSSLQCTPVKMGCSCVSVLCGVGKEGRWVQGLHVGK